MQNERTLYTGLEMSYCQRNVWFGLVFTEPVLLFCSIVVSANFRFAIWKANNEYK